MKKQTKVLMGIIAGLLILASAAGGLYWGLSVDFLFGKDETVNLANIEWYDEAAEEFTLTTVQELYELATLSHYYSFEGQTVKLGADIVVNEGTASDWAKSAPKKKWVPIENFAGTFDGQGHTISGVYGKGIDINMGLFTNTKPKAVIQNFKLVNSYFVASGANLGAVSANGAGTFKQIYTDAILSNDSKDGTGGFIGKVDSAGASSVVGFFTVFENCWFDGEINMVKRDGVTVGGFVGIFTSGTLDIKNCKSSGSIDVPSVGRSPQMGGFIGDTKVEIGEIRINLDGLMGNTKINDNGKSYAASYIGHVRSKCKVDIKNCYTTYEAFEGNPIGTDNNDHTGEVLQFSEAVLKGNGGYRWTNLDFDQFWTVVEGDLPTLKCFTDNHPSLEGVKKAFNTSWYSQYSKEMVLKTEEDFMGFCLLPYMEGLTFKGQVVKLDCDVTLNEGKSSEWGEKAPEFRYKPIGIYKIPFQGTFDGQGHTISGVYAVGTNYVGLFGYLEKESVLQNLRIVNSYFEGETAVGSLAGRMKGSIDSVYSNATVVCTNSCAGGIIGQSLEQKDYPLKQTINNCWFDGKLEHPTDKFGYLGGIIGDNRNNEITISNCLFSGSINSQCNRWNVFMGGICGTTQNAEAVSIIEECLSVGELSAPMSEKQGYIGSILGNAKTDKTKIKDSYAASECWEAATSNIAGFKFENAQWPKEMLKGVGGYQWTTLDFNKYWTAVPNGTPVLKTFATKIQSVKGVERYLDNSWYNESKDTYVLDSRGDFLYFNVIAAGNTFEGKTFKLGADIVINEGDAATWGENAPVVNWIPIGTSTYPFQGTLDGQGHSINGLYIKRNKAFAGIFAITGPKSTIKNMKIVNSYIEGTEIVATVVARGTGTLDGIYSDAYIASDSPCNGGIIGQSSTSEKEPLEVKINNCWYAGEMTLRNEKWLYSGGILGDNRNNHVTITNCLFTGKINCDSAMYNVYIGGINGGTGLYGSSKFKNGATTIEGCLSTGTIQTKSKSNSSVGAILGNSVNDKTTVKNCYGIQEGYKHAIAFIAEQKTPTSSVIWPKETITGFGGYEWTNLDFDNYWAVVEDGTPILKSFATSVPEIGTRTRYITWYDEDSKTYKLSTREELLSFGALGQSVDFKGKTILLEKDIVLNDSDASTWRTTAPAEEWCKVGTTKVPFAGTFNGQMHTISGLYINDDADAVGMFSCIGESGKVKNFRLVNSYIQGNSKVGSIAGIAKGNIDTVYTDAIVVSDGNRIGGIAGQIDQSEVAIKNCWYDGTIYATKTDVNDSKGVDLRLGGILGENRKSNKAKIVACLFTGEIHADAVPEEAKDLRVGGLLGFEDGSVTLIDNCLSVGAISTSSTEANGQYVGSIVGRGSSKTSQKPTNTYGAKESWAACTSWWGYNNPITDGQLSMTFLTGKIAYIYTTLNLDYWTYVKNGTPELTSFLKGEAIGSNVEYVADVDWYTSTAGGKKYTLTTPEQLLGFARLGQEYDFKGQTIKLGANIDLEEVPWLPVKSFAGTFDGDMNTISGMYVKENAEGVGMFRAIASDGSVQNLKLVDSYIEGAGKVGSIAGSTKGNISTIYTNAIIVSEGQRIGGIVGQVNEADVTIQNCWFEGELYANASSIESGVRAGGIVGENRRSTGTNIIACLFNGEMHADNLAETAIDIRLGGILGFEDNTETKPCATMIDNCVSVGAISTSSTTTKDQYIGSVAGRVSAKTNQKPTNTYGATEVWEACTSWWGYNNTIDEGQLPIELMTEEYGYIYTALDFDYWTYVKGGTPQLTSFLQGEELSEAEKYRKKAEWYTSTDSGKKYKISSKEELLEFARLGQQYDFKGQTITLTDNVDLNDIPWLPIKSFAGIFEGKNNVIISGLYVNEMTKNAGMFGSITSEGKVQNFKLVDSRIEGENKVGSIVGSLMGNINTIYVDTTVISNGIRTGGVAGHVNGVKATIENCWFTGNIYANKDSSDLRVGGILGENQKGTEAKLVACLFTGNIYANELPEDASDLRIGGLLGAEEGATTTIDNCVSVGTIRTSSKAKTDIKNEVQLFVGSLIGRATATNKDNKPTNTYAAKETWPESTSWWGWKNPITDGQMAKMNMSNATGYIYETMKLSPEYWVFIDGSTPELKSFQIHDEIQMTADTSWYTSQEEGMTYTLNSENELYGFVKLGQTNSFAGQTIKLGQNMDLSSATWMPMKAFAGTFDGQLHTISNLYIDNSSTAAMFKATTPTTVIKNFKLENACVIHERPNFNDGVGSVVGVAKGGLIDSIYSDADITTNQKCVGGIVGIAFTGETIINNCQFAGTITSSLKDVAGAGGIVGTNQASVHITNCLFNGSIDVQSTADAVVGGILGGMNCTYSFKAKNEAITKITGCMSVGTFVSVTTEACGTIVGQIKDLTAAGSLLRNNVSCHATMSTIGTGSQDATTIVKNEVSTTDSAQLYGASGWANTLLNDDYFVPVINAVPELMSFSTRATYESADVSAVKRIDTGWFNTTDKHFTIYTEEEFAGLIELSQDTLDGNGQKVYGQYFVNKTITLGANLVLNKGNVPEMVADEITPGKSYIPIAHFNGTFNGNGKTISGLYISQPTTEIVALFKTIGGIGNVSNFRLVNSYIEGKNAVASIAGKASGTSIVDSIYSNASLVAKGKLAVYNGGIVGRLDSGTLTINNCWYDGTMDIQRESEYGLTVVSGGILGVNLDGTANISNCLYTGQINTISNAYNLFLGGINGGTGIRYDGKELSETPAGTTAKTIITGCVSTGDFETESANDGRVAAILGASWNDKKNDTATAVITNCYGLSDNWTYASYIEGTKSTEGITSFANMKNDQLKNLDMNYWVYIKDGTPELRSFMKGEELK